MNDLRDPYGVARSIARECQYSVRDVYTVLVTLKDEALTRRLVRAAQVCGVSPVAILNLFAGKHVIISRGRNYNRLVIEEVIRSLFFEYSAARFNADMDDLQEWEDMCQCGPFHEGDVWLDRTEIQVDPITGDEVDVTSISDDDLDEYVAELEHYGGFEQLLDIRPAYGRWHGSAPGSWRWGLPGRVTYQVWNEWKIDRDWWRAWMGKSTP